MGEFEGWRDDAKAVALLDVANMYGAKLKRSGQEHVGPCVQCGGRDRFSINPTKGAWNCRGAEGGADAISLAQHLGGLTFVQACEELTGRKNPSGRDARPLSAAEREALDARRRQAEAARQTLQAKEMQREEDTREAALAIWNEGDAIPCTVADTYLVQRGFVGINDPSLRFHPSLVYPNGKKYPAMVCRVDDMAGEFTGIWRVFLRSDGRKADVDNPRLGLGPVRGGAVRLCRGAGVGKVALAEGIETALAYWNLTGRKYPCWAALSTAGMRTFEVPLGVDHVEVAPDGDAPIRRKGDEYVPAPPPGESAAQALRERLVKEGVRCTIAATPPFGRDFNDLWLEAIREVA